MAKEGLEQNHKEPDSTRILSNPLAKAEQPKQAHSEAHQNGQGQMETPVRFPGLRLEVA
jgi:hypothetical protein